VEVAAEVDGPWEEAWEEVWRPRRKGRTFEAGAARHRHERAPSLETAAAQEARLKSGSHGGKARGRRPDLRRGGGERERPRPHLNASVPPAKATFDPDSPFAALSSLKAQLEKRSQD
jgi:hypothetical protein